MHLPGLEGYEEKQEVAEEPAEEPTEWVEEEEQEIRHNQRIHNNLTVGEPEEDEYLEDTGELSN